MRIRAEQIEQCAESHAARGDLPVLVRRLIGRPAGATALAIPGGAAIGQPGFDGFVRDAVGNQWVPAGDSCWEMGTGGNPMPKAKGDYDKRTGEVPADRRAALAFVFVTPRRWRGKQDWVSEVSARKEWREVRAYDAVDLEHWLEQEPATALWFAELLGLAGTGVHSVDEWWQKWADQTDPAIIVEAMLAGREAGRTDLAKAIEERRSLVGIRADSAEEAAAFACAVLHSVEGGDALVVSSKEGWRYIDANPSVRVVIAASPEVATHRAPREGVTLIVPLGITDSAAQTRGSAADVQDSAIKLARPWHHAFVDALVSMGVEPSDAERAAHATGRSWPVYRRLNARNPALAWPDWLAAAGPDVLSLVCLLGAWSQDHEGDLAAVREVAGRDWGEVERDLLDLATIDDAPIVSIGQVWKARSPLELLYLAGPRITRAQLDRFFEVAREILEKPDPALALEPDQRWAAAIHGAVRSESSLLIRSICDALARLAVVGPRVNRLQGMGLPARVAGLVRQLLGEADPARWYSLERVLPELAEAAPDAFLDAVEQGLQRNDGGPASLMRASGEDGPPFGSCHHAGLLWALERLAWNPAFLPRVAQILARLCAEEIPSNWGNSPFNTLQSLFRPWWPQTTATDAQRLCIIDRLRTTHADVAWRLMVGCIEHQSAATANAQPRWREDNVGAPGPGNYYRRYAWDIALRLLDDAAGNTARLVELLGHLDSFGPDERDRILEMVEAEGNASNESRESLRSALRTYVANTSQYGRTEEHASQLARARALIDGFEPSDPVASARWLFDEHWIDIPPEAGEGEADFERTRDRLDRMRLEAFARILAQRGLAGVEELAKYAGAPQIVGWATARGVEDRETLVEFILAREHPIAPNGRDAQLVGTMLRVLSEERRMAALEGATARLEAAPNRDVAVAALYALAPNDRATWVAVDRLPAAIREAYWQRARPEPFLEDRDELIGLVQRFLAADRPRSAFATAEYRLEWLDPRLLFEILDRIRQGEEADGPLPEQYSLGEAFKRLEENGELPRRDVAMLEFAFFEALREPHGNGGSALIDEVLSDPGLFAELVCLVFKPASGEPREFDEGMRTAATKAWHVLRALKRLPGPDRLGRRRREVPLFRE